MIQNFVLLLALTFTIAISGAKSANSEGITKIPQENIDKGNSPPNLNAAEETAKFLFSSLNTQTSQKVDPAEAFFSREIFLQIKKMDGAEKYYETLKQAFEKDVEKETRNIAGAKKLEFKEFKIGSCKWKEIGSEYNRVAYWSCRKSRIVFNKDGMKSEIVIHTLINWGTKYYITHLGPLR